MALMKFQPGNILGGTFTFYLVATSWMTAKLRDEKRNLFDWAERAFAAITGGRRLSLGLALPYPLTIPLLGCFSLILTLSAESATAVYISVVEMLRWPRRRWT